MFGPGLIVPVPDVDRTDHLLDARRQPVRVERQPGHRAGLARAASRRCGPGAAGWWSSTPAAAAPPRRPTSGSPIRPGTDGLLLARWSARCSTRASSTSATSRPYVDGLDRLGAALAPVRARGRWPTRPASTRPPSGGSPASSPRRRRAAVYGRIGTTTAEFGTLASWLVDVLNTCTGNLDRPGGAMFTRAAAGASNTRGAPALRPGRAPRPAPQPGAGAARDARRAAGGLPGRGDRHAGRGPDPGVRVPGRQPGAVDARTAAGSTPRSTGLDFMVAVDIYVNETTRHADVILPAPSALQKAHYDLALLQLALRNVANWSEPVLAARRGPARRVGGARPPRARSPRAWVPTPTPPRSTTSWSAPWSRPRWPTSTARCTAATPRSCSTRSAPRDGPGPAGRPHAAHRPLRRRVRRASPTGSPSTALLAAPHGVDLGPLEPRLPEVLRTASGPDRAGPAADPRRPAPHGRASLDPPAAATCCSSAAATCARTTRGCTTSRCS